MEKEIKEDKKCPLCGAVVIFIIGDGWDYDREFCSNRNCTYDVELDTSTLIYKEED